MQQGQVAGVEGDRPGRVGRGQAQGGGDHAVYPRGPPVAHDGNRPGVGHEGVEVPHRQRVGGQQHRPGRQGGHHGPGRQGRQQRPAADLSVQSRPGLRFQTGPGVQPVPALGAPLGGRGDAEAEPVHRGLDPAGEPQGGGGLVPAVGGVDHHHVLGPGPLQPQPHRLGGGGPPDHDDSVGPHPVAQGFVAQQMIGGSDHARPGPAARPPDMGDRLADEGPTRSDSQLGRGRRPGPLGF